MRDSGDNKRKKVINKDTIIIWDIDGKTVKKSYNERLKEVRSQANQKTRDGDVIRSCGYSTKRDGSIQASARVENIPMFPEIVDRIKPCDSADIKDFAVNADDPQVLQENADLKKENQKLKDTIAQLAYQSIKDNQLKAKNGSGLMSSGYLGM